MVDLKNTKITDEGRSGLKTAVFLKTLNLANTAITSSRDGPSARVVAARDLSLLNTKISDDGVGQLEGLKHLKSLVLSVTNAPMMAFFTLEAWPGLKNST